MLAAIVPGPTVKGMVNGKNAMASAVAAVTYQEAGGQTVPLASTVLRCGTRPAGRHPPLVPGGSCLRRGEDAHRRHHGGRRYRSCFPRLHATKTAVAACARLPSAGLQAGLEETSAR